MAWIGLLAVVAWWVYPALTPVHVEGFSASIESLAIHLSQGRLTDYDALHPANLEFFALSRLGTVTFVAALIKWLGLTSEWAMRTTMWVGFATLICASIVLVRRWTGAPAILVATALVLIPGVSESAFFYNDNVLSSAFVLGALAVIGSSEGLAKTALAGLLFGAGVVARLDAVLLAPAVATIAYQQDGFGRVFVRRGLVFTASILVPVISVPGAVHASIFDVVRISSYAVSLWNPPFDLTPHARELAYFIGTPAALLVAFGVLRLVKERDVFRLTLLVGVPLFFNLVALGKPWQSRQLLPMTPFLAALAICGWQYLSADVQDRSRRGLRLTVLAVSAVVLLSPPARLQVSDGPRAPYGRLWSPVLWSRWQRAVKANMAEGQRLVESFDRSAPTAVLTDTWDADRYLHLHLQRAGFVVGDIAGLHSSCAKVGELFVRGDAQVIHLRLHQPFLGSWRALASQRLHRLGLPCLTQLRPSESYLFAPGARALTLLRTVPSLRGQLDVRMLAAAYLRSGHDPLVIVPVAWSDIAPLAASFAVNVTAPRGSLSTHGPDLGRAEQLMRNQVWRAGDQP